MAPSRRSIQQGSLDDFPLPVISENSTENTHVALVTAIKGQSIFEVSLPFSLRAGFKDHTEANDLISSVDQSAQSMGNQKEMSSDCLVQLPNKFKNALWVKRGKHMLLRVRWLCAG